jgi:S1-C subfamily serine protease
MKMMKKLATVAMLFMGACSCATLHPTEGQQTREASVRIVTAEGGGTGSIYTSSIFNGSQILTNKHVCELVKRVGKGQVVTNNNNTFDVVSFRESNVHDLCLVKVDANLGVNTNVAEQAPELGSRATVSGHPKLQPHTRTVGDFSNYTKIQVMIGSEPCTEEDLEKIKDPMEALMCALMGIKPIIKTYEAQYVSALIAPGSSGSAVYDEDGNIAAVVFAGGGQDLSFAYTVPWEYVHNFLEYEVKGIAPTESAEGAKKSAKTTVNTGVVAQQAIYLYDTDAKRTEFEERINLLYKGLYKKLKDQNTCLNQELLTP